ncbi:MAG: rod shape-determining protein MreC [Clostridiales bacterium]|nr:rod shape-determining protein MreC [Clostridiales bacterium]
MKLKVPKTERRKSNDSKGRQIAKRVISFLVVLVLLAAVGLHLFRLFSGNENLRFGDDFVSRLMSPLQTGFAGIVDWAVDRLYELKLQSRLELEYNNLRQENEQLVYRAMLADELQYRLSVYENLYDEISVNESMNPLVATVIGRESGNYFSVFTINKGSDDGVQDFMAVTMDGALVGYTYNVTPATSLVRTIIDSEASIAGLISSTRDQGTVRGTLGVDGSAMCRMYYLPEDHLPRPGDMVVTSGVGMSFPKGIPIGKVKESTRGMESNKQYIVVEPQADFQHVEYVIVLRYQPVAGDVEERASSNVSLSYTPLVTSPPVPTIQIGSDFYQLAPTPEPTPTPGPSISPAPGETLPADMITPAPAVTNPGSNSYEYQIPDGAMTDNSYGFTLAPTDTPTPTPPPLDMTVEEDE